MAKSNFSKVRKEIRDSKRNKNRNRDSNRRNVKAAKQSFLNG